MPADATAFTQGLEVTSDGRLFESTGQYGSSDIREVDLATGEVLRLRPLDDSEFGEGLTVVGDRLIVLTWQENTAIVVDPDTFEDIERFTYEGQGWGLCYDGDRLVMSDGSAQLTFRDPDTFEVVGNVVVRLDDQPLVRINELECVDDRVYANVWQTEDIVIIDPESGVVETVIDASGLLSRAEAARVDVLNGIAAVPGTDEFLITGKNWPSMFRVRFVPVD
ncbi:MAG: glutaminyl-peptide cyclotransferase [Acidimicrobiia bacterium]|nr:glutaminyl-peptide cyclotransferase [Acidimicrobiia bacterium]